MDDQEQKEFTKNSSWDDLFDDMDLTPVGRKRSMTWHAQQRIPAVIITEGLQQQQEHLQGSSHILNHISPQPQMPYTQKFAITSNRHEQFPSKSAAWNSPFSHNTGSRDSPAQNTSPLGSPSQPSGHQDLQASKRNPWGNQSYSELITQAISSMPRSRATLAQIYDWFIANLPYFRDRADTTSAAGWKNSVRHNLSLHQRFLRVPNEEAGKSSWWMVNPESQKAPRQHKRRRNTASAAENATQQSGSIQNARDKVRAKLQMQLQMEQDQKVQIDQIEQQIRRTSDEAVDVDSLLANPAVLQSSRELADTLSDYNRYRDRARSNVADYIMSQATTSRQTPTNSCSYAAPTTQNTNDNPAYFGNDVEEMDVNSDFVPNYMTSTNFANDAILHDIIDNTTRLQQMDVRQELPPGQQQMSPYYNAYHQMSNQLNLSQYAPTTVEQSPLWNTGSALTCDVEAVIKHELAAGTTNFDFDLDLKTTK